MRAPPARLPGRPPQPGCPWALARLAQALRAVSRCLRAPTWPQSPLHTDTQVPRHTPRTARGVGLHAQRAVGAGGRSQPRPSPRPVAAPALGPPTPPPLALPSAQLSPLPATFQRVAWLNPRFQQLHPVATPTRPLPRPLLAPRSGRCLSSMLRPAPRLLGPRHCRVRDSCALCRLSPNRLSPRSIKRLHRAYKSQER